MNSNDSSSGSDHRQIRVEELLAHQQHLIDALSHEVTDLRRELNLWGQVVSKLEAQLKLLAEYVERRGDDLPHEKPPHY
jgi:uncharacterized coiled-coil protein SlyX